MVPVAVSFDQALPFVLRHEGGFSNDIDDPGGCTNFGITQLTLDQFRSTHPAIALPSNVALITVNDAKTIYERAGYWIWDGLDSQLVATKLFDMAVNMGPHTAVKLAQQVIAGFGVPLAVDGILGPNTLTAINASSPTAVMQGLCKASKDHYQGIATRHPEMQKFLNGWLNRAIDIPGEVEA